jgi:hypothetical protein
MGRALLDNKQNVGTQHYSELVEMETKRTKREMHMSNMVYPPTHVHKSQRRSWGGATRRGEIGDGNKPRAATRQRSRAGPTLQP